MSEPFVLERPFAATRTVISSFRLQRGVNQVSLYTTWMADIFRFSSLRNFLNLSEEKRALIHEETLGLKRVAGEAVVDRQQPLCFTLTSLRLLQRPYWVIHKQVQILQRSKARTLVWHRNSIILHPSDCDGLLSGKSMNDHDLFSPYMQL